MIKLKVPRVAVAGANVTEITVPAAEHTVAPLENETTTPALLMVLSAYILSHAWKNLVL